VWIVEQVNQIPADRRLLVTNHEALGYFADRYGFTVIGAVVPGFSTDAAPSAQQMAGLIDLIKSSGAPAIFLGQVESDTLAAQIANETSAKVVSDLYLESLTEGAPAATYIDMMKHNVTRIVGALK
jgi:manganese/iron transport system substrate-binding protein